MRIALAPGDEPFGGVLVVAYRQDATQVARVLTPVAVTPGRPIEAQVLVHLAPGTQNIEVSLYQTGQDDLTPIGGPVSSVTLSSLGGEDRVLLEPLASPGTLLVGTLGEVKSLSSRVIEPWKPVNRYGQGDQVAIGAIDPAGLPVAWAGYQSFAVIIVHAQAITRVEPRAVAAMHQWVARGGRLLIIADQPGDQWRSWLPPGESADMVRLSDPLRTVLPTSMPAPGDGAVPSLAARAIELTDRGRFEGWSLQWCPADAAGKRGFLAEGPLGLGLVAIAGIDPARTTRLVSESDALPVWRSAVSGLMPEAHRQASEDLYSNQLTSGGALLDHIADVPAVGTIVFVAIAASMVLLALMLGPIDYILLGRLRRRQHSWATAPLWIALASGAAFWGPILLRPGDTRIGRFSVIDAVALDASGPPLACQKSITSIFADFSGNGLVSPVAPGSAGAFWHGVSPIYFFDDSVGAGPTVTLLARAASPLSADDPLGPARAPQINGADPAGSALPTGIEFRRWTLRAYVDESRGTLPLTAAIAPSRRAGRIVVRLAGLPPDSEVSLTGSLMADGWHEGQSARRVGDEWEIELAEKSTRGTSWYNGASHRIERAGVGLASASGRSESLFARARSGRWLVLHARVHALPMDIAFDHPATARREGLIRLALPLPDAFASPAAPRSAPLLGDPVEAEPEETP